MAIPIIGDIVNSIFGKVGDVVSEVVVDKDKRNQINADLERLRMEEIDKASQRVHDEQMGQISVNTEEAKNESVFVAGWRPAVGWIGAVGIGYSFIVEPFLSWTARVVWHYGGNFPALDYSSLLVLVGGMLGFGGFRTYEKVNGSAQNPPDGGGKPSVTPPLGLIPEEAPWPTVQK